MTDNQQKEINELKKQINELQGLLSNLETYIKVVGIEDYKRVMKYNIDYSKVSYLQKNDKLREKLADDCALMVRARCKDDFNEFCRRACLQIELIVDFFIRYQKHRNVIQLEMNPNNNNAIKSITIIDRDQKYEYTRGEKNYDFLPFSNKLEFCCDMITNDKNIDKVQKIKKTINYLVKNERDSGSHRDASDIPLK